MSRLTANTIHRVTVLQALLDLEAAGYDGAGTPDISEITLRPSAYDMGGRLSNMKNEVLPLIEKKIDPISNKNLFYITEAGREYHQANIDKLQVYGEYKLLGKDRLVSNAPSSSATQALNELQILIKKNTATKALLESVYNQIDEFLIGLED